MKDIGNALRFLFIFSVIGILSFVGGILLGLYHVSTWAFDVLLLILAGMI